MPTLSSLSRGAGSKRSASVMSDASSEYESRNVRRSLAQSTHSTYEHDLPPSPASSGRRAHASSSSHAAPNPLAQAHFTAPQADYDDEEGEPTEGERVLALHAPGQNNLAAAFYDPETRKLQILEDTKDTWGWDLAALLIEQFQPDEIVLSAGAPTKLSELAEAYCTQNPEAKVTSLPPNQFTHTMATYHLAAVRLPRNGVVGTQMSWSDSGPGARSLDEGSSEVNGEAEDGAGMGQLRLSLLKMGCRVNVDAPYAVCVAGALLSHLLRSQSFEMRGAFDAGFDLEGIESMDLEEHMIINQDALTSIGVFDIESHANMYSQKHKPGLSLNGVINTTITPLGRKLFHTWLLRPLVNIEIINQRLDAVQLLSSKDYTDPRRTIKRELKNIKNITAFCNKIKSGRGSWRDWLGLIDSIHAALTINETLSVFNLRGNLEVSRKLSLALSEEVQLFRVDVFRLIDFDASEERNSSHCCIRSRIDDDIDEWRENLAGLDAFLSVTGTEMGKRIPPGLCETLSVVYLPQLGCLVALYGQVDERALPLDWDRQFGTEDAAYYKAPEMQQLDDTFGDLENTIIDREIEWIQTLIQRIPAVEEDLQAIGEALAELDCLLAFADAVDRFDLRRPVMREEPILKIRKGFHPLHAMCVPSGQYIDNDTMLQGGGGENVAGMMVVTGANGSGKSAYGKQVALITFMAHIGCFVPAEYAEIGICDKIFTRVQTRESSSKTASAFFIDLSQVSQALRGATRRSLLILDEFGKGTTTSDGAGLLAGVITYLLKGPNPRTVLLTHYHQLFAQQFIEKSLPIIYCHMKSFIAEGSNTLTYLYKLSPTLSLTSNAAECALLHGIPEDIVQRARQVSEAVSKFQITKLIDAQLTAEDIAELVQAEELAKRFLAWEIHEEDDCLVDRLKELFAEVEEEEEEDELELGEGNDGTTALEHKALSIAEMRSEAEARSEAGRGDVVDLTDD